MPTPPHLAQPVLTQVRVDQTDDFVSSAMRIYSIDLDMATWPSRIVFEPERNFGYTVDGRWVATCSALSRTLTVPGGSVPVGAVTYVSVAPSYRRRGLLNQMMRHQLDDFVSRQEPVALLWASEAGIYGRYGYGPAATTLEVSGATRETAFRPDVDLGDGSVGEVDLAEWRAAVEPLHAALLSDRPGALARTPAWWTQLTSDHPARRLGGSPLRFALHYSVAGDVDGYLAFRTRGAMVVSPDVELRVHTLDAANPAAHARLWRFALDQDLVRTFCAHVAVDDPLRQLVQDLYAVKAHLDEALYARLVDVPRALAARRYAEDVDVLLGVRDAWLPANAGCWRLRGGPDGATVDPVHGDPDLELDVRDLGALYLGGTPATVLQRAGLVRERTPGTVAAVSRAFGWTRLPFSTDYF